jgi:2-keto-4-pentenoate hydratase/2-oxohepta-3-ene-1,7-dioic acid hydratase in catechol pathway
VKLVTFRSGDAFRLGALDEALGVLDLGKAAAAVGKSLPDTLRGLIEAGEGALATAREVMAAARGKTDLWQPLGSVRIATPLPGARKNAFCVGQNYKLHIEEMSRARGQEPRFPKVPTFFSKPPTTIVGHEDNVERHAKHTSKLDYEVELAVVIGMGGRNISKDRALDHVFGYTVVNDVTARDAQVDHGQYFKGKSYDTFCPIGPCVTTKDEFGAPGGHRLSLKVNGETRQDSNTSDLLFGVPEIIESLSGALTLEPGDIIATGTPSGVASGMKEPGWLKVGDVMEAEVQGIGVLRNRIVD